MGFCLLFRRAVVDEIGLLDERFGLGNFEDDDFCRRAIQAGWRAINARDAFVHHFGHRTFAGSGVDLAALLAANQALYHDKWGQAPGGAAARQPGPSGSSADGQPEPAPLSLRLSNSGGLLLDASPVVLSLCMIVRDNEPVIETSLESIKPWVDEMIVVDTGSQDRTAELARRLGARVFCFPWRDDFAAARNESLRRARGQWIFWMDSDDTIDQENGRKLRQLALAPSDPRILGYVVQVHCPSEENGRCDVTVVDHVKLFRNRPDLRFEGRIHEQIIPAIRAAGGEVAWTDLFVVHSLADHSGQGRRHKLERDLRILHLELSEKPDHPFVLFNLGMTYADDQQYDRAADYLKKSIAVSQPEESHLRKAYALLVSAHKGAQRHEDAWQACKKGLALFPDDRELLFYSGVLLHHFGRLEEAEQAYLKALAPQRQRHFTSVDPAVGGYKARHNLALVYQDLGQPAKAQEQWLRIVEEVPNYRAGWRGLCDALLELGELAELEQAARRLKDDAGLRPTGSAFLAKVFERRGELSQAIAELDDAVARHSQDTEPLQEMCRLQFQHARPDQALPWLQRLAALDPDNPSAHHNLATVRRKTGPT